MYKLGKRGGKRRRNSLQREKEGFLIAIGESCFPLVHKKDEERRKESRVKVVVSGSTRAKRSERFGKLTRISLVWWRKWMCQLVFRILCELEAAKGRKRKREREELVVF
jgi:hypothetical protein